MSRRDLRDRKDMQERIRLRLSWRPAQILDAAPVVVQEKRTSMCRPNGVVDKTVRSRKTKRGLPLVHGSVKNSLLV